MPQPRLLPPELNGASLLAMAEQNPGLFGGEMRTWQPSLRERIGNAVYDGANAIGLGGQSNRMRGDVQTAADFVPGVGDAIGAQEGAQAYGQGDYLGAALAALGVVPVAGDAAAKGIRAYHGSPHDFDRFSMDKIGTGEGAQVYGHGLYFAENEGVAQSYRDALSGGVRGSDAPQFKAIGGSLANVSPDVAHDIAEGGMPALDKRIAVIRETISEQNIAQNRRYFGDEQTDGMLAHFRAELDELEKLKGTGDLSVNEGRMYEVNINADPDSFLDWDLPLREQSEAVRKALPEMKPDWNGGQIYESSRLVPGDFRDPAAAAGALRTRGIHGIRYYDQNSRGSAGGEFLGVRQDAKGFRAKVRVENRAGMMSNDPTTMVTTSKPYPTQEEAERWAKEKIESGTRNLVVFDEDLISIVRKYGIAGAVSAGLISQEVGEQMRAQGIGEGEV